MQDIHIGVIAAQGLERGEGNYTIEDGHNDLGLRPQSFVPLMSPLHYEFHAPCPSPLEDRLELNRLKVGNLVGV